ncbi:MAG: transcriptional regulator [Pseudotabrizicola sp.]|uniref:transcriptional regulator n=1 Tax=Pseudotabrizicola sp. TaxID=2939647 RepID=UPI002719160B|nr:transcriptional regulator [Pseudotabrizicola sp.]MDO8885187.1 transcriptional regulator [Pseudotabrizicola sp.]MDP2082319.1 transcriptional regulator [Pseudotabrizicola sp.]MDZ7574355.1 transcriptional regulator [Pseudotabrizicola sp.]
MPRTKIIPDPVVFSAIRTLLAQSGERGASFAMVSRATGLAAPTLVQRYGSQDGMVREALLAGWDALDRATDAAEGQSDMSVKGAQMLIKALSETSGDAADLPLLVAHLDDPTLRLRAMAWRVRVEQALAVRLGGGAKGREAAALLFAAWQGQMLWQAAGDKGFRLKDAIKRLT